MLFLPDEIFMVMKIHVMVFSVHNEDEGSMTLENTGTLPCNCMVS
jgi:hypothetical protein